MMRPISRSLADLSRAQRPQNVAVEIENYVLVTGVSKA